MTTTGAAIAVAEGVAIAVAVITGRKPVRQGTFSVGFPASFQPLSPSDITDAFV